MTIRYECPKCGRLLAVTPDLAGRDVACPFCQAMAVIPLATAAPAAPDKKAGPWAVAALITAPVPLLTCRLPVLDLVGLAVGASAVIGAVIALIAAACRRDQSLALAVLAGIVAAAALAAGAVMVFLRPGAF